MSGSRTNAEAYYGQHAPDLRELVKLDDYRLFMPWFESLFAQLQPGSRVLELGCSAGWLSLEMARHGADVLAIDLAAGALEIGQRYLSDIRQREQVPGHIEYRLADANTCELPTGAFDWVVMTGMLHHAPDPEVLLRRVAGWLRPGGRLCIMDPLDAARANSVLIGGLLLVLPTKLGYGAKFRRLFQLRGQAVQHMSTAVEGRDLSPFEGIGRTAEPRAVVARVLLVQRYVEDFGLTSFLAREIQAPPRVARFLLALIRPLEWGLQRLGVIRGLRYVLMASRPEDAPV